SNNSVGLRHKAEIGRSEPLQVGEDSSDRKSWLHGRVAVPSEPLRQCCCKLINCRRRNPTPGAGVVRTTYLQRRIFSVGLAAIHRPTHHEMVAAPSVVAAQSVAGESAPEIAGGKACHTLLKVHVGIGGTNRSHRILER